ncbi:hypothetical protein D1BOALGB6SA_7649 [Olavius sp. associated proteobacterium Delta 1]|nr:hypothetical protein D1BOALGB6SA_7649 [Olavius sp. associated proteobacterium Delta 1]
MLPTLEYIAGCGEMPHMVGCLLDNLRFVKYNKKSLGRGILYQIPDRD